MKEGRTTWTVWLRCWWARAVVSYFKAISLVNFFPHFSAAPFQKDEPFIQIIARDTLSGLIHATVEDSFIYKLQLVDEWTSLVTVEQIQDCRLNFVKLNKPMHFQCFLFSFLTAGDWYKSNQIFTTQYGISP